MARGQPVITALARWLPVSLVIHAAALAGVVAIPRERTETPLFVDLTAASDPPEPARTRPEPDRPAGRPRSAVRAPAAAARDAGPRAPVAAPRETLPPAWTPTPVERPAPAAAPPPAVSPLPAPVPSQPAVSPPLPAPAPAAPPLPAPAPPAAALAPPPPPVTSAPVAPLARPESPPPLAGSGEGLTDRTAMGTTPSDARSAPPVPPGAAGGDNDGVAGPGGASAEVGGASGSGGAPRRGGAGAGDGTLALAVPGDGGGEYGAYLALLRRRVQEAVRYPESARRRSLTGTAHVQITLEPSGRIAQVELVRSSSHRALDDAALDGVRALRRIPFPPEVAPRALRVRLPVVFELR
jgi:TonB family protein